MVTGAAEPTPPSTSRPDKPARAGKGRMLRAKPPNVVGGGPLLGGPGFGVVVVCIVKDEAEYLEEWLAYHVAVGVGHFIIYDNGSTDGSAAVLERYINHGLVTRVDWPLGGGQLAAYNHALRMFGATARWLAYFDVDEFLVPLLDDDVPTFLARFEDAAVVRVPRIEFGYSGHRTPPPGLAIDAYTQVANVLDLDADLPPRVKSIVQPGAVSAVDIHLAFPADEPVAGAPTDTAEEAVHGIAQLNHYYTRSLEEFEAKRFRGSATGRIARPAVPFDIEVLGSDTSAGRFSARTQVALEQLRSLAVKPYAYGSQLALEYFPRPNDLFRFGEFAIANTAAGLAEPSRVAAARLRNLHRGVGLMADLAGSGYQPVRDGISSSVHLGVLVQHMRGRIVVTLADADADADADSDSAAPASLRLPSGSAEVRLPLPAEDRRSCYYLGFLASTTASVRLTVEVSSAEGGRSRPVELQVPASTAVAGIVEIEPRPVHGEQMRLTFERDAGEIDLHDLFVIATG